MSELTEQGIAALQQGRREEAHRLLMDAVSHDPCDAVAWLHLADAMDDDDQRAECLRCVLEIESDNTGARVSLEQIEVQASLSAVHCPICGKVGRITCPKCNGERIELCSACQGQTFQKCEACHGSGWRAVEAPLVLSSSLNSQSEGKWRECVQCHATGRVDCRACQGRGRDWCHTCEGSGWVICPNCASDRLKPELGEALTEAVLSAIWFDHDHAQTLLAAAQDSSPLANFLWRVGFADRPYHTTHRLRMWVESHPQERAGRCLLNLLPSVPSEQLPPRDKPVRLIKQRRPTPDSSEDSTLVTHIQPGNAVYDAIMAMRIGNRDQALVLLLQAVEHEPHNEQAWLWLSRLVETDAQRIECLRHVLDINPCNGVAQQELERLI